MKMSKSVEQIRQIINDEMLKAHASIAMQCIDSVDEQLDYVELVEEQMNTVLSGLYDMSAKQIFDLNKM